MAEKNDQKEVLVEKNLLKKDSSKEEDIKEVSKKEDSKSVGEKEIKE